MINISIILKMLGYTSLIEGLAMVLCFCVALFYQEENLYPFVYSALITLGFGFFAFTRGSNDKVGKKEGFLIVVLIWLIFASLGALPFLFSGAITSYTDAFFESMSGFTTTGSSVVDNLNDHTVWTHSLLFWRSLIQWLGGLGIIILTMVLLPLFGVGGMKLFNVEATGPQRSYLGTHTQDTARKIWLFYLIVTVVQSLFLWAGEMTFFEAICHSFTTMATGGFSTKQESLGGFSAYSQYVTLVFMVVAGINYALPYLSIAKGRRGSLKRFFKDEELKLYVVFIVVLGGLLTLNLWQQTGRGVEQSFRDGFFWVVSIITTTGFGTNDFMLFPSDAIFLLFITMFLGGCAGSTSGSIKIVRVGLLLKNTYYQILKNIHPHMVVQIKMNDKVVSSEAIRSISAFILSYIAIFIVGSYLFSLFGYDIMTSMGAVATHLGNVGPGLGQFGPAHTFSSMPTAVKWLLSFMMLMGRLEIFTVLVIFTRVFWRRQ